MAQISAATGRRKTAIARVTLKDGSGKIVINGSALEDYFTHVTLQNNVVIPLQVASATQKYDVTAKVTGGGLVGQVGAIKHAMARALLASDDQLRKPLRDAGLLTRDPRMKERKKPGQPGARARFQFSKR